ncbi:hypothetical protein OE88DRAFT_1807033 [Heliocybe sulcata]|uniref:RRM domain-containing protein n=1 Tax=Heliocybe sulcata TaxID=5364 RepID=A0A5C3N7C4_9AGAM|nr:hypothetical protein OE88DRAFT_1807033 [Heliocybe sulcata]
MSKVVFVGNVPYNMGEEQLIDAFKSVGQVIGFRLVFDRETGKPRGYGFCEFTGTYYLEFVSLSTTFNIRNSPYATFSTCATRQTTDHETAMSAVRNLNNVDVGGRPLRIDLADSDPFLEGKTTVRGEIIDSGESRAQWREREREIHRGGSGPSRNQDPNAFLTTLPPGVPVPPGKTPPDVITQVLAEMPPPQVIEVLAQMKAFVITHPEQARALLMAHPQLGYALFQALIMHKILDEQIIMRMQAAAASSSRPPTNVPTPVPSVAHQPPFPPNLYGQPPPHLHQIQNQPPMAPTPISNPSMSMPPPMHGHGQPHMPPMPPYGAQAPPPHVPPAHVPQSQPSYYQAPPPHAPPTPTQAQAQVQQDVNIDPQQKAMLLQVLGMTAEQINALDPAARDTVNRIRSQFFSPQGFST